MAAHESIVEKLLYQRNAAETECKSVIEELKLMTAELESVTKTMKEQSDAIDEHLKVISAQHITIEELEARIAALEKDDPDLSIYDDMETAEPETERQEELDAVNTAVVLVLAVAVCMIATIAVVGVPLSDTDL